MKIEERSFADIAIGEKAEMSKTVSEYDIYGFAGITGDFNPAHINEEAAKSTRFGKRIAHGVLSLGLVSAVLGVKLPGPGSIFVSLNSNFKGPVFIGDTVTATVEVAEKNPEKRRLTLTFAVVNQKDEVVVDGTAILLKK